MRTPDRRGFSLIELLLALVMLGLFASAFYKVLIGVQRVSGKQTQAANMQGNLRSGIELVQSELQELRTDAALDVTDIISMSGTAIRYRAMRGVGEACAVTNLQIKIRQATFYGPRDPTTALDSLALYRDIDTTQVADDEWVLTPFTYAGTSTCPDGNPAWAENVDLQAQYIAIPISGGFGGGFFPPTPIRTYEEMELGLVTSAGKDWLGIRSVNNGETTLIPVIGPLATGGVLFQYYDLNNATPLVGNSLATRSDVRVIVITLTGLTAQTVHTGQGSAVGNPSDVMTIRIQLRNAL